MRKEFHGEIVGGVRSKEYQTWIGMRLRCKQKPHYVRRGIKVCDRWNLSFAAFLRDVGRAPSVEHTLDRYPNPNGNYEPGNVRWATMLEQRHNRAPGAKIARPWLGKKRNIPQRKDGRFSKKKKASDYMERIS
jgi:hypothetical protein